MGDIKRLTISCKIVSDNIKHVEYNTQHARDSKRNLIPAKGIPYSGRATCKKKKRHSYAYFKNLFSYNHPRSTAYMVIHITAQTAINLNLTNLVCTVPFWDSLNKSLSPDFGCLKSCQDFSQYSPVPFWGSRFWMS